MGPWYPWPSVSAGPLTVGQPGVGRHCYGRCGTFPDAPVRPSLSARIRLDHAQVGTGPSAGPGRGGARTRRGLDVGSNEEVTAAPRTYRRVDPSGERGSPRGTPARPPAWLTAGVKHRHGT